jgi:hypothetical protein
MAVVVTKPALNVRSELADLRKPTGIAGEAMLAADTIIQQAALLGVAPNNLVKNGAMAVYQRGAGTIVSDGSAVKEAFGPDRFKLYSTEAYTVLDATIRQTADGPEEFSTCSEVEIDTLEAVAAATDLIMLMYNFEGLDLQGLGWGTSAGKPLTLQFWVKSNTPGKYALSAYMPEGGGDIVTFAYTINQSAVWQKVVWVIPPNTAAVPANDNTASLVIRFVLAAGTTYKGGTPQPNWGANANNLHAAEQVVDLGAVDASYFRMTGVQATIGAFPEGVPFQHRSYGEELAACERYYQSTYKLGTNTGETEASWGDGNVTGPKFSTEMRAAPAVALYTYDDAGVGIVDSGGTNRAAVAQQISAKGVRYLSLTSGTANTWVAYRYTANAEL